MDIAKEEERHWDNFAAIQQSKKEREMDGPEKVAVDNELHVTMVAANTREVDKQIDVVSQLHN
jgi:rubrerythrin